MDFYLHSGCCGSQLWDIVLQHYLTRKQLLFRLKPIMDSKLCDAAILSVCEDELTARF